MGKKKGKDKNKLSRMSEEERLRYLQHRAELEEEAKRRKQQLISTFMKVRNYTLKKHIITYKKNIREKRRTVNVHHHDIYFRKKHTNLSS
jgi:hypothetical protein